MTKLLQCLRDELVRRDYAATTIRSYIQIVDAFHHHTGARLDRITPAELRRYHRSGKPRHWLHVVSQTQQAWHEKLQTGRLLEARLVPYQTDWNGTKSGSGRFFRCRESKPTNQSLCL